jgi:hypothetical protein
MYDKEQIAREKVESYVCGNISDFKLFLRNCKKEMLVLVAIEFLNRELSLSELLRLVR